MTRLHTYTIRDARSPHGGAMGTVRAPSPAAACTRFAKAMGYSSAPTWMTAQAPATAARRRLPSQRDHAYESEARLRNMEGTGDYEGPRTWP